MIVDQGTILDRIDYNLENASYHIKEGTEQLAEVCAWCRPAIFVGAFLPPSHAHMSL
jgi:hypothetical protein